MKTAVIAITAGGQLLAKKLSQSLAKCTLLEKPEDKRIASILETNWRQFDGFICIMATGIVVRSIAALLEDKYKDPAILVMDEEANNVISLLSGHIGGGNALTLKVAEITGANPVITTASDVLKLTAIDLWIRHNNLAYGERTDITTLSAKLVNYGRLTIYTDLRVDKIPKEFIRIEQAAEADILVSNRIFPDTKGIQFVPKNLVVGSGCKRGTPASDFHEALSELFQAHNLQLSALRNLASIDKKNDEAGLLQFAAEKGVRIDFYNKDKINTLKDLDERLDISKAALKAVGAIGVAEPTSLLSAQSTTLLSRKRKWKNITMAIAEAPFTLSVPDQAPHYI